MEGKIVLAKDLTEFDDDYSGSIRWQVINGKKSTSDSSRWCFSCFREQGNSSDSYGSYSFFSIKRGKSVILLLVFLEKNVIL